MEGSDREIRTFLRRISQEARLPVGETRDLISEFLNAISRFVGEDAWDVLVALAPDDVELERNDENDIEATIEEFPLEMSDIESVEAGRAAEHARVVAERLRSRADESHLERLADSIENEELVALIGLSRGELTEPEVPTVGKRAQSGELSGE